MSAVAKLLQNAGVQVTGSDVANSVLIQELTDRGFAITVGPHDERNVPDGCDAVIYTSAAPEDNPERQAALHRHLPQTDNFTFLGEWFTGKRVVLVTGTHGKSTVTALLGEMCIAGGLDPTVFVGSKVPGWKDHNLHLGSSDLIILEGDEYARHFLAFHPNAIVLNNLELDHPDVYEDVDDVRKTFERLLRQSKSGAFIVANGDSDQIREALKPVQQTLKPEVTYFGWRVEPKRDRPYDASVSAETIDGRLNVSLMIQKEVQTFSSSLLGSFNAMNITAAVLMARKLGVTEDVIRETVERFSGIWRRMEYLGDRNGVPIYSDYGHHPTAVRETIAAVREAHPDKRLVLCFQPHHRNRTKVLFSDFISCFDRADVLVLCEIYDVAGRSDPKDAEVSSSVLLDAVKDRQQARPLSYAEYAPDPTSAVRQTLALLQPNDFCVFMSAGDLDTALRNALSVG